MVIQGAENYLLEQRRTYGDDCTLLARDDPYILTSLHPTKVVLRFASLEPFQSSYETAWNTVIGISNFYCDDPRRTGSVTCFVADRTISHKKDEVIVAHSIVYSGQGVGANNGNTTV